MVRALAGAVAAAALVLSSWGSVAALASGPDRHPVGRGGAAAELHALVAQSQPDRAQAQDDELEEGERVGHGDAKDLPATTVLATVAAIAAASLVVVLAGFGVFGRRTGRRTERRRG